MSDWQPYLKDRLIRREESYVVIIPKDAPPVVPLFCPICETVYRSSKDEECHIIYGCCDRCVLEHLGSAPSFEDWLNGWRPSKESVDQAVCRRPPMSVNVES